MKPIRLLFDAGPILAMGDHDDSLLAFNQLLQNLGNEVLFAESQLKVLGHLMDIPDARVVAKRALQQMQPIWGMKEARTLPLRPMDALFHLTNAAIEKGFQVPHETRIYMEAIWAQADVIVTFNETLLKAGIEHAGLPHRHGAFATPWICTPYSLVQEMKARGYLRGDAA
jgi:hypothetical protein